MPPGHECCAEKLGGKIEEIRDSQIRMEQKAESSWDPAAEQTWRNKKHLEHIKGALVLAGSLLGLSGLGGFLVWLIPRVVGGG